MLRGVSSNTHTASNQPINTNSAPPADADLPRHQIPTLFDLCTLEILRNPSINIEKLSKSGLLPLNIFENFPHLECTDDGFPVVNFPEWFQDVLNGPDSEMKAHCIQFIWIFLKAKLQFNIEYSALLQFTDTTKQNWFDRWLLCNMPLQEIEYSLQFHDHALIQYKSYPDEIIDSILSAMDTMLCEFEDNGNTTPRLDVQAQSLKGLEDQTFSAVLSEMSQLTTTHNPQKPYAKKSFLTMDSLDFLSNLPTIKSPIIALLLLGILSTIFIFVYLYKSFHLAREQSKRKHISSISEHFRSKIIKSRKQQDAVREAIIAFRTPTIPLIRHPENQIKRSDNLRERINQALKVHNSFQQLFNTVNHPA